MATARGEDCRHAKLTSEQVAEIRSANRQKQNLLKHIRENLAQDALSSKYGVTKRQIQRVIGEENWNHAP